MGTPSPTTGCANGQSVNEDREVFVDVHDRLGLHQPDRAFYGIPQRVAETLIGDGLGETFDTKNLDGFLGAVSHEERDLPFA
jgi:hypothetical protein